LPVILRLDRRIQTTADDALPSSAHYGLLFIEIEIAIVIGVSGGPASIAVVARGAHAQRLPLSSSEVSGTLKT